MIVPANTDALKRLMWTFLNDRGVQLQQSADFQAIGRFNESGKLLGVVAFNGFCGRVCSMHCAGDGNWVSREFIAQAFHYPFVQLNLGAILAPVPANNHKALKFDTHFGFREVHRVPDGWEAGVDLILLQMMKSECRYLMNEVKRELAEVA